MCKTITGIFEGKFEGFNKDVINLITYELPINGWNKIESSAKVTEVKSLAGENTMNISK